MVGLTGTHEQVAQAARAYRVYYSKPPKIEAGEDYLVDHSIFFYLMNPHGQLSDFYGKDYSAEYVTNSVQQYIRDYLATTGGQWPTITTPATPSNKDVVTSTTTSTK
jgi:protein SCO1/2